jgi:hypothetical protein
MMGLNKNIYKKNKKIKKKSPCKTIVTQKGMNNKS